MQEVFYAPEQATSASPAAYGIPRLEIGSGTGISIQKQIRAETMLKSMGYKPKIRILKLAADRGTREGLWNMSSILMMLSRCPRELRIITRYVW